MLVAGCAVPAIVNLLILAIHVGTGWTADLWLSWRQWMLSSIFPTITIPPLFVLAITGRLTGEHASSARPRLELALLGFVLLLVGYAAFSESADTAHWPALFLAPVPFLIWAAVRLGVGGTCLALLVVATPTLIRALQHQGPFAHLAPVDGIVSLQLFLIVTSVPLILLAALMDELRRTTTLLRQSESRMKVTASATDTGLWQWDGGTRQLWLTDHCREMFDLSEEAPLSPYSFLETVDPADRDRLEKDIDLAMAVPDSWPGRHYKFRSGGTTRWLLLQMFSQLGRTGLAQVSGVFRDVTSRVAAEQDADELRQRLHRLRDDERRRIAEELHDSTAQHLVAARLKLSALKLESQSTSMRRIVAAALKSLREATLEIRTFSYLLHPPQLQQAGLSGVLQEYLPGFESRTGVATSLRVTPLVDVLSADQQHAILRIAQESLSNVHRHARATRVSVSVRCIAGNVHLIVSDDGKGIHIRDGQELSERLRLGVGIPGMTARVQRLGGRINVDSDGKGTTVHVAIPLAEPGGSPSLH